MAATGILHRERRKVLEAGDDGSGWCGICSASISVRGMLDCCSHEYCFDCIENWSSVSNQCPLCKLQFRFISVENVYDEDIVENHSPPIVKQEREEEEPWESEAAALPFSFPSFFIDEDAVACLEGHQCLVRAGVPLPDEDAADTSVACDSCDHWYHAGCVGFDPSISWGSWLCPRCSSKAAANKSQQSTSSFPTILPLTTVVSSSTSGRVPVAELASYATEYDPSVSIAVVGEDEPTLILSTCKAIESAVFTDPNVEIIQASDGNCADSRGQVPVVAMAEEVVYPPLKDKASTIQTSLPSAPEKLESETRSDSTRNESKMELEVAESADLPSSYFDDLDIEEQPTKEKWKKTTRQDRDFVCAEDLPEPPRKIARSTVKKKETVIASTTRVPGVHAPKIDSKAPVTKDTSPALKKQVDRNIPYTENVPLEDLVHMVKDELTVNTGLVKDELTGRAGGVRTRVVMRRDSDGRTAQIVKDIRQQMRSAAGYGATGDHGKMEVSDDRFFAAYKAAMVRNNEKSQGVKPQSLKRRRNSWMDKMLDRGSSGKAGGIRESLTKKLYGGGVSRKTWDRDWDVSFWKEQSARIKKAKQEASGVMEGRAGVGIGELPVEEKFKNVDLTGDCILSRLYVADTSLFPRDDDIKPLYMLGDVKDEGKMRLLGGGKVTSESKSVPKSQPSMIPSTVTKPPLPSRAGDTATNGTANVLGIVKAPSVLDPDEKKDKRQWARELLARKSGDVTAKGHGATKKESSLLEQVPVELRPTLPPDRRSRVPTAVRQSQLNRIIEHYLRKAKLTSLQGGYKLKSVIASAVAKETEIYDSSNSKGVYVNLCVRALAQQVETRLQVSIPEPAEPDAAAAVTEALVATGLDSPPGSTRENHTSSEERLPRNQAPDDLSIIQEASKAEDVEDKLEISSDVYQDMNLDFDDESIAQVPRPVVSLKPSISSKNKMKVVLTSSKTISESPQVLLNNEQKLEESSTGRENDVVKENSAVPGEGEAGGQNAKRVESGGESEGDDTCTFPDLESRIDKVRKDVLNMSSTSLSQFSEEHVFVGSLQEPTFVDEVPVGRAAKPSSVPDRKGNGCNSGGKETSSSVKKQVEAYVKEHLKPLYKSGVIKSDQFRFAVSKTASKVMQYHKDAISADFLIVEGSKVKKVADQYLQSYVQNK